MQSDTFDAANPFFIYDMDKLCGICTNKLDISKMHSLDINIAVNLDLKVFEVLESISNFKFSDNGPKSICSTCFQNTSSAYKFQQMCNAAQMYLDKFIMHQNSFCKAGQNQNLQSEVDEIQISQTQKEETTGKQAQKHEPKKVKCKVCNKWRSKDNMKSHMRIHTGEKPYKCDKCDASFVQWTTLRNHVKIHENKRGYICTFCGKGFNININLRRHEIRHTGEKPYQCNHCELGFCSKSDLKRHEIVHTNEKPFTCEYCAKSFNRRSTLRTHLKIHTGERPHVCNFCGKSFIQYHCLKSHLLTHGRTDMQEKHLHAVDTDTE